VRAKWGARTTPTEPEFSLSPIYHTTFRQLHNGRFSPNLAVTRESMSLKNSVYRSFAAKQTHNGRGQTGILLSPADGPGTHCRDKLFISRCSSMVREFLRSVNFFVRRTVLELPGVKVPHFFKFCLFSNIESLKVRPVTSLQRRGYTAECFWSFHAVVGGRSKGVPFARVFFLRRLMVELGPQSFPHLRLWEMLLHGASDLDERRLKTRHSGQYVMLPLGYEQCSRNFWKSSLQK